MARLFKIAVLPLLLFAGNLSARTPTHGTVTLAWDPSVSPGVVGYRLYQGAVSQTYTNIIDVGNATNATVTGLTRGITYFFAVTAFDAIGLESLFSNEVSFTLPEPATPRLQVAMDPSAQIVLSGSGPAGAQFQIETSEDLITWTPLEIITVDAAGAFQFTDPVASTNSTRFYRVMQTQVPPTSPISVPPSALERGASSPGMR